MHKPKNPCKMYVVCNRPNSIFVFGDFCKDILVIGQMLLSSARHLPDYFILNWGLWKNETFKTFLAVINMLNNTVKCRNLNVRNSNYAEIPTKKIPISRQVGCVNMSEIRTKKHLEFGQKKARSFWVFFTVIKQ